MLLSVIAATAAQRADLIPIRQGPARGQPLTRQAGPLQSVSHDEIVKERRVLLPYLVFLMDESLLDLGCECRRVVVVVVPAILGHGGGGGCVVGHGAGVQSLVAF